MIPDSSYVALALTRGIGPVRLDVLMRAFGSAGAAISASPEELASLPGMNLKAAYAVRHVQKADGAVMLQHASTLKAVILTPADPRFPNSLKVIPEPPPLLFATGDLDLLSSPGAGIVGSRDNTQYGARVTRKLAMGCARSGVTIVSGMARGLDAIAHEGALDVGGRSIGVLGNGLGVVYPASNRVLYQRMREHGCLVSEFPLDARPTSGSFPRRNRIISALSKIVIVVEARAGSGALITADAALNQGKEVGAVPGPIDAPSSVGTNRLIQLGAKPILEVRDILEEFGVSIPDRVREKPRGLSDQEQLILQSLAGNTKSVDGLAGRLNRPSADVLVTLTALEIRGLIQRGAEGWRLAAVSN